MLDPSSPFAIAGTGGSQRLFGVRFYAAVAGSFIVVIAALVMLYLDVSRRNQEWKDVQAQVAAAPRGQAESIVTQYVMHSDVVPAWVFKLTHGVLAVILCAWFAWLALVFPGIVAKRARAVKSPTSEP